MQTKLTLRLDDQAVRKARSYARVRRTSLSRIVEEYFRRLEGGESATSAETPVLSELAGLLAGRGNPDVLKKSHPAIDDLLREVARRHPRREEQWSVLFALGDRQAARAGLTEADVRREIKAVRKRRNPSGSDETPTIGSAGEEAVMETTVTVKGQVVIPAQIRRRLVVKQGTRLNIEEHDGAIVMRPVGRDYFERMSGILTGESAVTVLEKLRREQVRKKRTPKHES